MNNNKSLCNDTTSASQRQEKQEQKQEGITQRKEEKEQGGEERDSRKKRLALLALALLLLAGALTFVLYLGAMTNDEADGSPVVLMPDIDVNAEDITDAESLQQAMQEAADASYFTLQVYPEAEFSSTTGSGAFFLMNPSTNVYPITFVLTLDATGEILYQSGTLMPGQQVRSITLKTVPSSGIHEATANVTIFNHETQEKEGETQAKVALTIQ